MASFRLLDIPVRVKTSFLIIAVVLAWLWRLTDWRLLLIGVAGIFVSILIHELGHAFVARSFGAEVSIVLNGLGGLTRWSVPDRDLPPGRRALVAAAGSAAGFAFGGLVWVTWTTFGPFQPLVNRAAEFLVLINVFWGLLNWLPIRPLDGGHLTLSLLSKLVAPARAEVVARVVFSLTAAAALLVALNMGLIFIAAFAGWMLLSEIAGGQRGGAVVSIPEFGYDDEDEGTDRPEWRDVEQEADPDPPTSR